MGRKPKKRSLPLFLATSAPRKSRLKAYGHAMHMQIATNAYKTSDDPENDGQAGFEITNPQS